MKCEEAASSPVMSRQKSVADFLARSKPKSQTESERDSKPENVSADSEKQPVYVQ